MKKLLSSFASFFLFSGFLWSYIFAQTCDVTFPAMQVRYGQSYTFTDSFTNQSNVPVQIKDMNCINCSIPFEAPGRTNIFTPGATRKVIEYNGQITWQNYKNTPPPEFIYDIVYCQVENPSVCDNHVECQPVDVSRCGDGSTDAVVPTGETWIAEMCDSWAGNIPVVPVLPYGSPAETFCLETNCSAVTVTAGYCGDGAVDLPYEECEFDDATPPYNYCGAWSSCNYSTCQCLPNPVNGVCNSVYNNKEFETNDINYLDEQWLVSSGQPSLCSAWSAWQWEAVYNPQTGKRTWSCGWVNGGNAAQCSATRTWCGDGDFNGNQESCDPGTGPHGIGDIGECETGQQCNSMCSCDAIPVTPTCWYLSNQIIYDFDDQWTFPDGSARVRSTYNGLCPVNQTVTNFAYSSITHQWTWNCDVWGVSSPQCSINEYFCGDGKFIFPSGSSWLSNLSDPISLEQCEDTNTSPFDTCITFTWANNDIPYCKKAVCGDGVVNISNPNGALEACDGDTNGDNCSDTCLIQGLAPTCGDGSVNQVSETCDPVTTAPAPLYGSTGSYCQAWCTTGYVSPLYCGDNILQLSGSVPGSTELCDGLAGISDPSKYICDGCKIKCNDPLATNNGSFATCIYSPWTPTFCGDGNAQTPNSWWVTEICDDGSQNTTTCTAWYGMTCNYCTLATCMTWWVVWPYCGDGTYHNPNQFPWSQEECDGSQNISNGYICTPTCKKQCNDPLATNNWAIGSCIYTTPTCGDGTQQNNEDCDLWTLNGQLCVPQYGASCEYCTMYCERNYIAWAYCGDAIIQPQREQCDLWSWQNGPFSSCSTSCSVNTSNPTYPDLVIQKKLVSMQGGCVTMTGTYIFSIEYGNMWSQPITNILIQDLLPAGLLYNTYDSFPLVALPTIQGQTLSFSGISLQPGQTGKILLYTTSSPLASCPNNFVNTATITIPQNDPTPYNNSSSITIPCHQPICNTLTVTPSVWVAPMTSQFTCNGTGANYRIEIKNKFWALIHTINAQTGSYIFTDIGQYTASCFVDGKTSPACSKPINVGGSCERLTTDVPNGREISFTWSLSCKGNGSQFKIQLFNNNILQKSWQQNWWTGLTVSHYFDQAGDWRAICYVDGVSHPVCNDDTSINFTTQSVVETLSSYQQQKEPEPSYIPTITITTDIDPNKRHVSLDTLIQWQTQDILDVYMQKQLANMNPWMIAPDTILMQKWLLYYWLPFNQYIHHQSKQYQVTQKSQCTDYCEIQFNLKSPLLIGSGYCGDTIKQTPNSSWFNEQCDHGLTGNDGITSLSGVVCTSTCLIPGWWGGWWWGSNFCGDGITRNGEECDNGTTGNNGTTIIDGVVCDSNCKKIGASSGWGWGGGWWPIFVSWWSSGWSKVWSVCGNAIRESGEACDLGSKNGDMSICTSSCRLKWFTPNDPKCEYIDPPSIQAGEMLPIWWNYEGGWDIVDGSCHTGTVGKILQSSLQCHFTIKNPKGIEVDSFSRPCDGNDIANMKWYPDFVNSLPVATRSLLQSSVGVTSRDASKINADSPFAIFGEYTVSLDTIAYDICRYDGQSFNITSDRYEDRVCQYNFAVTTPYAIQKGVGLSSFSDDKDILSKFFSLGGTQLLQGISFDPITTKSRTDVALLLQPLLDRYDTQATQQVVDATSMFKGMRKVPGQEIYVTDHNFILDTRDPINTNKATVLIALGDVTIRVLGSLNSRMMILAPQGTITFENTDCDSNDSVEGVFVAWSFDTNTVKNTLQGDTRCSWGGLVVDGLLIGGGEEGIKSLRDRRRSTLNDWFSSSFERDQQIFDGASLRIQSNAKLRSGLPQMVSEVMKELKVSK
jgi:Domain of unknown function DUF11